MARTADELLEEEEGEEEVEEGRVKMRKRFHTTQRTCHSAGMER